MNNKKIIILKTSIGSHAHGLATPESDYDYRGVYVNSTSEILSLNYKYKGSNWIEGQEDNTSYEIGHFLQLALKCNPSILEVFKAPVVKEDYKTLYNMEEEQAECVFPQIKIGRELRELFPYIWNPQGVYDAFVGYGLNQRKKMLDNHLDRWNKYGVAYVRTLINLISLLKTKDFTLVVPEEYRSICLEIKNKKWTVGQIIDLTDKFTAEAEYWLRTYESGELKQEPDPKKVNEFLLKVRKEFWS